MRYTHYLTWNSAVLGFDGIVRNVRAGALQSEFGVSVLRGQLTVRIGRACRVARALQCVQRLLSLFSIEYGWQHRSRQYPDHDLPSMVVLRRTAGWCGPGVNDISSKCNPAKARASSGSGSCARTVAFNPR